MRSKRSDLAERATINDLMSAKGQETPEDHSLIAARGFFYRLVRHKEDKMKNDEKVGGDVGSKTT